MLPPLISRAYRVLALEVPSPSFSKEIEKHVRVNGIELINDNAERIGLQYKRNSKGTVHYWMSRDLSKQTYSGFCEHYVATILEGKPGRTYVNSRKKLGQNSLMEDHAANPSLRGS